ncbi:MAG: hypothetical protein K5864_05920 [Bacteroidales bacterium]|nr:hypothetical protein [Bacteroidales bacterium]
MKNIKINPKTIQSPDISHIVVTVQAHAAVVKNLQNPQDLCRAAARPNPAAGGNNIPDLPNFVRPHAEQEN